ncbi:hypothetical protein BXY82_2874 [Gelidibacter sediminis]|uniref:Uncharacterized protein n=1 Tax=Gelidibacter sediminis TaxID=1608710 RepID=A0A4R7PK74_9FLAO|nr:hypothetical protein [Gelidibacter sediminis]TDU34211.1 hypothetical protein BXY82_2874 [Gelidibacter sediminis]
MTSKRLLRNDYILVLLVSVMYFLAIKDVIAAFVYLVVAVVVSIYFFPARLLFLENDFLREPNKKKVALALSYFVISNIITLTALIIYADGKGFLHTTFLIYSIINLAFLLYFHFQENMRYNFILSIFTTFLSSAVVSLQY